MQLERTDRPAASGYDSFLQTPFWAEFKAAHGWEPLYFTCAELLPGVSFPLTVLVRRFSNLAAIAYVPMGPPVRLPADQTTASIRAELLRSLTGALKAYLPANTLCVRYDAPWETRFDNREGAPQTEETFPVLPPLPVCPARENIQPPDTVIIPLQQSEEEILSGMKSKWRYNIRLSEKKGVSVRQLSGKAAATEGLETFYQLYRETAERDSIALHDKAYYRDLLIRGDGTRDDSQANGSRVFLYLAEHEAEALASIIVLYSENEATYLYGASSNSKRNLMPAYLLQWRSICDAKAAGMLRYDMYGIPPRDDSTHPMYGLYRFKTGFGGEIVHRSGSLDLPLRPFAYRCYRLAEACRSLWFKKTVKWLGRILRRGTR